MAKSIQTTQEKKLHRNKDILARYNELKKTMTCRQAQPLLADMYSLSEGTINKILFVPTYAHSPLPTIVETGETKSVPVLT